MADRAKKISELTAANTVANTDLFVFVANAAGNGVTKTANASVMVNTIGPLLAAGVVTRTVNTGVLFTNTGVSYSTAAFTWNGNTVNLASTGANSSISIGNTTVNTSINATSVNISGVTATGNTTVTGFVNVSTYGTFGGTVNATALNLSSNTINLNGVTIIKGSASTRLGVNTEIGSTGSNGSIYLSTAGKIYLKVANTGVANDDWQRVTTTAVD